MRDYILEQANSRNKTEAFPALRRIVRNWWKRRGLRRLESLDDHMLMDMGLTREELVHAQYLPLDIDPVHELMRKDRARHSKRGQRHS
ncbi:hypothetical protein BH10PSE7_BH10PSE7_04590 [soil metagenome]